MAKGKRYKKSGRKHFPLKKLVIATVILRLITAIIDFIKKLFF